MHVYFVKSASRLFKYNNTLKLNIFNQNILLINNYKFCKIESDSISLPNQNEKTNSKSNVDKEKDKTNDISFEDLDKFLSSINNSDSKNENEKENNIMQFRLYNIDNENQNQKASNEIGSVNVNDNGTQLSGYEKNELITKKDELPSELKIEKGLSRQENIIRLQKRLVLEQIEDGKEIKQKSKIGISMFILLIGLFSLWIPLYKTICETQGFSVKTGHQDYTFQNRTCKLIK
jgi:hypothetical protein